jgi:hypothetical protein
MSQIDDRAEMAEKAIEVALIAVLVVLCRDHGWTEDKALALLAAARGEVANVAGWLERGMEQ